MDINSISTLISSVGFPIACCCVLFYQNSKFQEALTNLSSTLQTLVERIQDTNERLNTIEKEIIKNENK